MAYATGNPPTKKALTRLLYCIEWTHDDGMDQHQEFAMLTPQQAGDVENLLRSSDQALDIYVYVPAPSQDYEGLMRVIREDLPL